MNNNTLSIGFIGAGRVGNTLGRYFFEKGLPLSGFFSRTYESACEGAAVTSSKAYKTIKELVSDSKILFITVPDSEIYNVFLQLKDYELKDKILCHCSGALSAAIFEGIDEIGAHGYSLHPALAISHKDHSLSEMADAYFTLEGSPQKMPVIESILKTLGNPFQVIEAKNKHKYHAALVMSSNLVIGIYHMASSLLEECGFSVYGAKEVLNPLFLNNSKNLCMKGCCNALTGPVDRNDISTIAKHLSALDDYDEILKVYKLLTKELISIVMEKYPNRNYQDLEYMITKEKEKN